MARHLVVAIARNHPHYAGLRDALDALPGWGPRTIGLFLRELRGVWHSLSGGDRSPEGRER